MAQEIESHIAKDALVTVNHQTILHQYLKDLFEMDSLLFLVVKCNEYVIQIDERKGDASQEVINQPLERLPSI